MESYINSKIKIMIFLIIIIFVFAIAIDSCNYQNHTNDKAIEATKGKTASNKITNVETEKTEPNEPTEETVETEDATEDETVKTETEDENLTLVSLGRFTLTAYCSCSKCCGKYALNRPVDENGNEIVYGSIGVRLVAGVSIAVDPRVIPYGSEVVINGHKYTAHDTGGGIKGKHIDVYFDDHQEALNFGVRYTEVFKAAN